MVRVSLAGAALAVLAVIPASPASADCSSPSIAFSPTEVARGQTITVVGTAMGTECYDTGPPPPGEGVLGRPAQDVAILLRQTDDVRVGTADAAADYSFSVEVRVPEKVIPGQVFVVARLADGVEVGNRGRGAFGFGVLTVTNAPTATTEEAPKASEPANDADTEALRGSDDDGGSDAPWALAAGSLLVALMVGAAVYGVRRARQ